MQQAACSTTRPGAAVPRPAPTASRRASSTSSSGRAAQRGGSAPRRTSLAAAAAAAAAAPEAPTLPFRVGHGWDLHRLEAGYPLIVGGIDIPHDVGCVAHSGAGGRVFSRFRGGAGTRRSSDSTEQKKRSGGWGAAAPPPPPHSAVYLLNPSADRSKAAEGFVWQQQQHPLRPSSPLLYPLLRRRRAAAHGSGRHPWSAVPARHRPAVPRHRPQVEGGTQVTGLAAHAPVRL